MKGVRYPFYTCDVFTERRFGGNPLAVLPRAEGLSEADMLGIAREFNFSETTFVLPAESQTRRVRIFTPLDEIPFAGHPNIGTAFVLARAGELGRLEPTTTVTFEEKAGVVPVTLTVRDGRPVGGELVAPEPLTLGTSPCLETLADAVSLTADCFVSRTHPPLEASVGLPFLFAELRDLDALARARVDRGALDALAEEGVSLAIHLYVRTDERDVRARVFIAEGGYEDPATGSASCTLAGLLSHCATDRNGDFSWRIAQGVEMGRPNSLLASARKRDGEVVATRAAGACVMVSEGFLYLV